MGGSTIRGIATESQPRVDATTSRWQARARPVSLLTMASGMQYLVFSTIGMLLYPGGTKVNPSTTGYLFFQNMFSDMGRTVSHSGASNVASSTLFIVSLALLALALVPFYAVQSSVLSESGNGVPRLAFALGTISATCLALAGPLTQDLFPVAHLRVAQLVFVFVVPAALLYARLIYKSLTYPRIYAHAYVLFTLFNLVGMVAIVASGEPDTLVAVTIQATFQKVMVYAWTAIMFIQARGLLSLGRGVSPTHST